MLIHIAHANGIPGAAYQPLLERLQPHRGLAIPRLGHNPAYPATNNWDALIDELIDYLERHADEPVVGVGHSLGSILTFMTASRRPDLFRGVMMLDPPLLWGSLAWLAKIMKRLDQMDRISPSGKSRYRRRHWPDRQSAVDYFSSKPLFQFHPDCFAAFCDAALEPDPQGVTLWFNVPVELAIFRNTPDNLRSFTRPQVPVQLVYGAESDATLERAVLPFCRHFDIPHRKIPGGHMFPLQQPDLIAQLICTFADSLATP